MLKLFEWATDDDSGYDGWRPLHAPSNFDPGIGTLVAHDCLEHTFPNDDGRVHFEFMALGQAVVVRITNGYVSGTNSGYHTPHTNLASEWQNLMHIASNEYERIPEPPGWGLLSWRYESDVAEVVHLARKQSKRAWKDKDGKLPDKRREFLRKAEGWFRHGVRIGHHRYRDCPNVTELFRKIEREATRLAQHAEEGNFLAVDFVIKHATAQLSRFPSWDADPRLMTNREIRRLIEHASY